MLTHAASEWAMDRHIAQQLFRPPAMLLQADDWLVEYVADRFDCTPAASHRAIRQLAGAEALLRHSSLPARLDYYIQEVACRLPQINRVFAGETPAWLADCPQVAVARERIAAQAPERVACRLPLPGDLFEFEVSAVLQKAA